MKKLIALPLVTLLSLPALANTGTTTTRSYESSSMEESSVIDSDADMIEAEEYDESLNDGVVEEERMEERVEYDDRDSVDYSDRTRTNRARHAINTGSDASDDK